MRGGSHVAHRRIIVAVEAQHRRQRCGSGGVADIESNHARLYGSHSRCQESSPLAAPFHIGRAHRDRQKSGAIFRGRRRRRGVRARVRCNAEQESARIRSEPMDHIVRRVDADQIRPLTEARGETQVAIRLGHAGRSRHDERRAVREQSATGRTGTLDGTAEYGGPDGHCVAGVSTARETAIHAGRQTSVGIGPPVAGKPAQDSRAIVVDAGLEQYSLPVQHGLRNAERRRRSRRAPCGKRRGRKGQQRSALLRAGRRYTK